MSNNMKLFYVIDNTLKDISNFTTNYKRSDNKDALGQDFSFDLVCNPLDKYYKDTKLNMGGKILFENNGVQVFVGVIKDIKRKGLTDYSYTCYDFAWYLNKDEVFIQFKECAGKTAIEQICSEKGISIGKIDDTLNTKITKVYNGNNVSDAIKDIIKQCTDESGIKYRMEVRESKLYIESYTALTMKAVYKPSRTENEFDVTLAPGDFSSSYSIADRVDKVIVVSSSEKENQVLAEASAEDDKRTYGTLVHYEKVDKKNAAQAGQIAKTKLAELNKIKAEYSVKLFGDDKVRAGRILEFNQPDIDMVGKFLVVQCSHEYNQNNHFMTCKLEKQE